MNNTIKLMRDPDMGQRDSGYIVYQFDILRFEIVILDRCSTEIEAVDATDVYLNDEGVGGSYTYGYCLAADLGSEA